MDPSTYWILDDLMLQGQMSVIPACPCLSRNDLRSINAEISIGGPRNHVDNWLTGLPLYAGVALLGLLGLRNIASLILDS